MAKTEKSRSSHVIATPIILLFLLLVGFALLAGNYHIVSGTSGNFLIPRISFGYEDIFGSVSDCTSSPWIIASAQHGKLCRALQKAGYIESDEARDARVRREIEREMEKTQRDIQRQTEELMRRLYR